MLRLLFVFLVGCGSKTGLLIDEFRPDGGADASWDAGRDAGFDANVCEPGEQPLTRRVPEIMFVIDRSRSMRFTIDGREPEPDEISRWDLLRDALDRSLRPRERDLAFGALTFPDAPDVSMSIEEACQLELSLDVPIRQRNTNRLLELFDSLPAGGTPTAPALDEARRQFTRRPLSGVTRFAILATDGAPNCNPSPPVPPPGCTCTGDSPEACLGPDGAFQCLDDTTAIEAIDQLFRAGIPVYVIGSIDDPRFAGVLDQMAEAGGRPRMGPGRQFYDVRVPADFDNALQSITDTIARCVFYLTGGFGGGEVATVEVDGMQVPRDDMHVEGWDFTDTTTGEVTFFGGACDLAAQPGATIRAITACPE
jgi:hypothetical protein